MDSQGQSHVPTNRSRHRFVSNQHDSVSTRAFRITAWRESIGCENRLRTASRGVSPVEEHRNVGTLPSESPTELSGGEGNRPSITEEVAGAGASLGRSPSGPQSSRLDTTGVVKITASASHAAGSGGAHRTIYTARNRGHQRAGTLAQVRFLDDSEPFAMQGVCGDLAVIDHQRDRVMAILHPDQRVGLHQIDFGAEQGGANSE